MPQARYLITSLAATVCLGVPALAQDWDTVPLVRHDAYQAVYSGGGSAYTGGFPIRLRGVVLNNPEDWLDPTPAYDPGVHLWQMGGEWEIFVQAVDDPNLAYDDGDLAGTAAWMGQNYGNHIMHQDPWFSYTNDEWLSEMDRVNQPDGPGGPVLRAGDLVEVRARAGLHYQGKMNVNEQHSNDRDWDTGEIGTAHDFEIVILQPGYGLPAAEPITLADLKDAGDAHIFDPTRQTGGERYQMRRVTVQDVQLVNPSNETWHSDTDPYLVVTDGSGRTFEMYLGLNGSFDRTRPPAGTFDVTGVINQGSASGQDGYYLMALHADDFSPPLQRCGDANCDGVLDVFDINPFVLAIMEPGDYAAAYPGCDPDVDGNGVVDVFDINPFVDMLLGDGTCP